MYDIKFPVKDARIFIDENVYRITLFDIAAISNYYGTELTETLNKIAEEHDIDVNDIEIMSEAEMVKVSYNVSGLNIHISKIKKEIEDVKDELSRPGLQPDKKTALNTKLTRLRNNLTSLQNQLDESHKKEA